MEEKFHQFSCNLPLINKCRPNMDNMPYVLGLHAVLQSQLQTAFSYMETLHDTFRGILNMGTYNIFCSTFFNLL